MKQWQASNTEGMKRLGTLDIIDNQCEHHDFEILYNDSRIVFGNPTNNCFLESGYMERNDGESLDESLQELTQDLEAYYMDGKSYVSRIVCNERM